MGYTIIMSIGIHIIKITLPNIKIIYTDKVKGKFTTDKILEGYEPAWSI